MIKTPNLDSFITRQRGTIDSYGSIVEDSILGQLHSLENLNIWLTPSCVTELRDATLNDIEEKYMKDLTRMIPSIGLAVLKLITSKTTRQAIVLNDQDFYEVLPCFLYIQFIYDNRDEGFVMSIHQRSSDIRKLKNDLLFFGVIMRRVENLAHIEVESVHLNIGSFHRIVKPL